MKAYSAVINAKLRSVSSHHSPCFMPMPHLCDARAKNRLEIFMFPQYYLDVVCLFDLILYVPSTIFQLNRDGSSWVEPVLS